MCDEETAPGEGDVMYASEDLGWFSNFGSFLSSIPRRLLKFERRHRHVSKGEVGIW